MSRLRIDAIRKNGEKTTDPYYQEDVAYLLRHIDTLEKPLGPTTRIDCRGGCGAVLIANDRFTEEQFDAMLVAAGWVRHNYWYCASCVARVARCADCGVVTDAGAVELCARCRVPLCAACVAGTHRNDDYECAMCRFREREPNGREIT